MSETPRNDTERDAKLAALYHAAAQDGPPVALDDAIRAAARRAVASRPRLAGLPFSRSWGVPLSIAAVIVLSVSLVTLLREEAPELAQPPRAEAPAADAEHQPAASAEAAGESAATAPKTSVTEAQRSPGVGLKPPQPASAPGIGIRSNTVAPEPVVQPRKEMAEADRVGAGPPSAPPLLAKRAPPEAFPGPAEVRDSKEVAAPAEKARQSGKEEARRDVVVSAEAERRLEEAKAAPLRSETASADSAVRESGRARVQTVPAPAAKPVAPPSAPQMAGAIQAYANLPPVKWLEQIESLRKQGRLEEARTSFAEFRRRYPDYPLPDSLKDWARP